MIGFTHLVFALALTYLSGFPVVTPVAAASIAFTLFLLTGRKAPAAALWLGYVAHLFLDTFTYSGIMWLFPVENEFTLGLVGYADVTANLGITALSLLLPVGWSYRNEVRRWMR